MNIGDITQRTGIPARTLRYYEDIGLVTPARAENGYRDYSAADLDRLMLIAQARHMGFSLDECRRLAALNADPGRASREVRALAQKNLAAVQDRIARLRALEAQLRALIAQCHGDDQPDCAILEELSGKRP
ncbi:MerR family transcriptional regulator [Paenirhodobacter populi]|uniref:MerR family transcriptional regulator n=1 Tax=Paenirhodobacter populi TaxID=2306993 RepID=A0A443K7P0_9RHOB|nr:MerR family transcriptional regulator [Sinirhodobacter populi]RWR09762.1 MerR family transcriptional regulator [Sinirhodobacter populi]RWR28797.1 MerR family transcriptional regulator [Sinirhodobacter populi]RWR31466.1 MerR family transcriptional regulator [Sinirhodobacter populi]